MKDKLCTYCGYVGKPTTQGIGSFAVDGAIWLIFLGLSIFSSIFALMVVPLAWSIYHFIVYKTTTCPECGNITMVGLNSHKAKEYRERKPVTTVYSSEEPTTKPQQ
jgi:hypothetical protein